MVSGACLFSEQAQAMQLSMENMGSDLEINKQIIKFRCNAYTKSIKIGISGVLSPASHFYIVIYIYIYPLTLK